MDLIQSPPTTSSAASDNQNMTDNPNL
jgi:hypothetical protein